MQLNTIQKVVLTVGALAFAWGSVCLASPRPLEGAALMGASLAITGALFVLCRSKA